MNQKRVAIIGISGRMGTEISHIASQFLLQVTAGVARSSSPELKNVHVVDSVEKLNPELVDVVIDFSLPELTSNVVDWCVEKGKPLVSGVTGLSETQKSIFLKASHKIPVLWSPNMSLGIAVLSRMLAHLAELEGFEYQIEELHHKHKKDRPSGTAVLLQEKLQAATREKLPDPVAIRGGGVFGIHRIWAMGEEETITLEHTAMNRRVFARGALRAAEWILTQPSGFYRMDDVLGRKH